MHPPDKVLQRPLHYVKHTAWAAISKHGIIGPFWFENDDGHTVTVNKECYVLVLGKFYKALCAHHGLQSGEQWF